MKHLNIIVFGRVQGVGFRNHSRHMARYLGIKGYVKNLPDGSVFIEAEGDEIALAQLVQWCRKGTSYAQIDEIKTSESALQFYVGFEVRY